MAQVVNPPEEKNEFEDLVLQAIIKKQGVSEEEAKMTVAALKKNGELEPLAKGLATLASHQDTLSRLPTDQQNTFASVILAKSFTDSQSSGNSKFQDLIMLKKAGFFDDAKDDKWEKLTAEITALKDEKSRKELEDFKNAVLGKMNSLEAQISVGNSGGTTEKTDAVSEFLEKYTELEDKRKGLLAIFGVQGPNAGSYDFATAKQKLVEAGYKVEGPATQAEVDALLAKARIDWKKEQEEAVRKAREDEAGKAENFQKNVDMAMNLGSTFIDVIGLFLPDAGGKTREGVSKLGERLRAAKKVGSGVATQAPSA